MRIELRRLAPAAEAPLWRSICGLLLFLAVTAAGAAEPEMLANGDMEAPFVNRLAQGWVPNCYGSNEVIFAQESVDVHGGKSAQRVTRTRFADGGVQFHSADIAVQKGQSYTLRLWMKGDVTGSVYVGIRKQCFHPVTGCSFAVARSGVANSCHTAGTVAGSSPTVPLAKARNPSSLARSPQTGLRIGNPQAMTFERRVVRPSRCRWMWAISSLTTAPPPG
ncbi:MAG: carbohydrate binding domain-containing protein [Limisphaerales bacterium]